MGRVWKRPVQVLSGLLLAAMYAMPQAYTVSAKPGAINYIEGNAFLNSKPLSDKGLRSVFLDANDVLSTDIGKAEVLLTPGVFLRVGENSQVRMVSSSLTNTQVEVSRGEVMLEATGLMKENNVQIINHGSSTTVGKNGLYRFTADNPPTAAVLDGKATVTFGDRKIDLKKGKQTILAEGLRAEKFDAKKSDNLYAWSNVRSEYEAAASYRVSQSAYNSGLGSGWRGFGYNGFSNPGWYWDNGFSSWAWLPGAGAFYSPFGYGFYSPGLVAYAPVVVAPVYGGWRGHPVRSGTGTAVGGNGVVAQVPISPRNPPAIGGRTGAFATSPWANQAARSEAARSLAASGLRTGSGAPAPSFAGRGMSAAPASSGGGASAGGGGFHGAGASAGGGFHGGGGQMGAGASGGGGGFHGGGGQMSAGGGGGRAGGPSRH